MGGEVCAVPPWRALGALALGQLLSLLITATGFTSSQLVRAGIDAPTSQSFCNYALLAAIYGSVFLCQRRKVKKHAFKMQQQYQYQI
eukprot:c43455_g1_i1 orf=26-286(-)